MLDFEVFTAAFRHVFSDFVSLKELTSESIDVLPEKYQSVTARIDLSGDARATLWLNVGHPGVVIAMKKLNIPNADEDRMFMDTVGELLNIIVGSAQRNTPCRYDFSLPRCYKGEAYPLRFAENARTEARRFIFEEFETILILEQA
ncbi:MAG: chemotaxis protein CheX [Spirochaetes bacterium]|nr:chemotaxis protein CheX [Spirochaetota bacterium]